RYLPQCFMILFSVFLLIIIPYQINVPNTTGLGPRFLPNILSVSILVLSLLSLIPWEKLYKQSLTKKQEKSNTVQRKHYSKILLIFIDIILWIILTPILGFVLATTLVLFVSTLSAGNSKVVNAGVFALCSSILLYFLFASILHVPL